MDPFTTGIIGGAVGGGVAAVVVLMQMRWHGKFLAALHARNPAGARALLDKRVKPVAGKVPLTQLVPQRARMAALAIMGDTAALERELAGHQGGAAVRGQVTALGVLGLAIRSADALPLAHWLDAVAAEVEREANAMQKLLVKKARQLAALGRGVAGAPVSREDQLALFKLAGAEDKLTGLVMLRALALVAARGGQSAKLYEDRMGEHAALFR